MVEHEFLCIGAEESGVWDDLNLPQSNMDMLQKVRWSFLPNGRIVLEIDDDVAKLLSPKPPDGKMVQPTDHAHRFSHLDPE
jgi:hypothetical protein